MKYVLVSGGVISGVGKGIIASSTGLLLKTIGLKIRAIPTSSHVMSKLTSMHVSSIKIDPYLNVDAGTMNPKEHGEVFVLDDGGEVDLDLGNYERYLNVTLTRDNNITTGKIYKQVIDRERKGVYLGRTVQVVPHITDAIQDWIERVAKIPVDDTNEEPDVCIIELGGTIGDIESMPFVEAMTQLRRRAGRNNFLNVHVSYVPIINGEQKTKPTQQAVKTVRSAGLIPDLVACRCEKPLDRVAVEKLARFCQVENEQIVVVRDMPSIYQVPILLEEQGLIPLLREGLRLDTCLLPDYLVEKGRSIWHQWKSLTLSGQRETLETVTIVLVGKYIELHDSYISVIKSLEHCAMRCKRRLNLVWVDSEHLEQRNANEDSVKFHKGWHQVCTADGILVPGGFGSRGTEGMIAVAKWARETKKPYLGICLGMQVAVIEYARNVCGIEAATSEEFSRTTTAKNVVIFMPEIDKEHLGGTMRLGRRPTLFQPDSGWSKLRALYADRDGVINERHRHRYEVNPEYIEELEAGGLRFIGKDDKGERMEIIELEDHPWFVGVQFHPEYLSRVLDPSRPYLGFIAASGNCLDQITSQQTRMTNGTAVNGQAEMGHF